MKNILFTLKYIGTNGSKSHWLQMSWEKLEQMVQNYMDYKCHEKNRLPVHWAIIQYTGRLKSVEPPKYLMNW